MIDPVPQIDARKATDIARDYLTKNFGNLGLLMFRLEQVRPNTKNTNYFVTCSILSNVGSNERIFYVIKVDIEKQNILEVHQGKKEGDVIKLQKMDIPELNQEDNKK